jgi:hypothetical protein
MNLMFLVFSIVIVLGIALLIQCIAECVKITNFTNNLLIGQYYKLPNTVYKCNPWLVSYKVYAITDIRKNDDGKTWVQFRNYEMTRDKVLEMSPDVNYVSAEGLYKMGFKLDPNEEHYIYLINNFIEYNSLRINADKL